VAGTIAFDPRRDAVEQLLEASFGGHVLDARSGRGRHEIRAEHLREAALHLVGKPEATGIRLLRARLRGVLDLRAIDFRQPLRLVDCVTEKAPRLEGARLHELVIAKGDDGWSSELAGLRASGLRLDRDLVLSGTRVSEAHRRSSDFSRTAAVWLTEAQIGGRILAVRTVFDTTADRAIQADRTLVTGDVRFILGFRANAEVRLLGMHIGGSLDLTGATLVPRDGRALDIASCEIGGSVFLINDAADGSRLLVRGRIEAGRSVIGGRLLIRNADLAAPSDGAKNSSYASSDTMEHAVLVAQGLVVHGWAAVEGDTHVHGGIYLHGAELRAGASLTGIQLRNAGELALDLSQGKIGGQFDVERATIEGSMDLSGAVAGGAISLADTRITRPSNGRAIRAVGMRIGGDLWMRRMEIYGGSINLRAARITSGLDAHGAQIVHPGDRSISLRQAQIGGNVALRNGFRSIGVLVLDRVSIGGRLAADDAALAWTPPEPGRVVQEPNPRGCAVDATSATISSGTDLGWSVITGAVDFTDATTSYLADRPTADWPEQTHLDGFRYQRFAPVQLGEAQNWSPAVWDAPSRVAWLYDTGCIDPGPWEQASRVLRENGDFRGSEDMLIGFRRSLRRYRVGRLDRWWNRFADRVIDLCVGYGHRPQRMAWFMAALVLAVVFSLTVLPGPGAMRAASEAGLVYTTSGPAPADEQPAGVDLSELTAAQRVANCGHGAVRCFNPTLYALDTVVPIIDLNQRAAWYPSTDDEGTALEWWLSITTILGWFASTVFVLALARLGSSRA